jgi:hypothetical protein
MGSSGTVFNPQYCQEETKSGKEGEVGEREKKTKEEEGGKRKKEYMTNI